MRFKSTVSSFLLLFTKVNHIAFSIENPPSDLKRLEHLHPGKYFSRTHEDRPDGIF